jgi:hypothetical protein
MAPKVPPCYNCTSMKAKCVSDLTSKEHMPISCGALIITMPTSGCCYVHMH